MERTAPLSFGQLLKRYRTAAGLSQEALAERAALTSRAIMYLERGVHTPYPATIARLVPALGLSAEEKDRLTSLAFPTPDRAQPQSDIVPRNPYKGLRAFTGADAGDFFGREDLIGALLSVVGTGAGAARFLAVVGPSGSGKSSVVLAGLLPRLQRGAILGSERWVYLDPVLPGAHPLEALTISLATALPGTSLSAIRDDLDSSARGLHLLAGRLARQPDVRVVLLVDQCEELFTLTTEEAERQAFIDLLATAAGEPRGALQVVLTLRADFYDRPMRYPALGRLMEGGCRLVLPMDVADLRTAIEQPAALQDVGIEFADGLVNDLLFEVRGQAGALPLLQFTLDQLFERREERLLTVAAYHELGGVRGALARHAEAAFAALPSEEHRRLARALFLRLIDPGSTEYDTPRRRAALTELALPDPQHTTSMLEVADAFVAARLLIISELAGVTSLEVSHEALIREWSRLAEWLYEARDDIRMQQGISTAAMGWAQHGCPADRLYRGAPLDEALAWAERNTASATEQSFLAASLHERQRQEAEEHGQRARELALAKQAALAARQASQHLRYLAGVLVIFLLVSAGLTIFAIEKAITADTSAAGAAAAREAAVTERNLATARQLAAQAINHLGDRYDLALLLSLEATRIAATGEARGSLLQVLQSNPGLLTFLQGHTGSVTGVTFSRDGRLLASGDAGGAIRLWDVAGRRQRSLLQSQSPPSRLVNSVAFSPDGRLLAAGGNAGAPQFDGTLQLWSVATGQPLDTRFAGQMDTVKDVIFSPDGRLLAAASGDGAVRLWRVATGRPLGEPFADQGSFATCLAFSADGKTLFVGTQDGTVLRWDVATRRLHGQPLSGHSDVVNSIAMSADGTMLASGSADRTIRLWNAATGRPIGRPWRGHAGGVTSVVFSPNGRALASGSADRTVRLWDVGTGQLLGSPLRSHTDTVNSVSFSPDGRLLASGGGDTTIRLWDLAGAGALSWVLRGHTDTVSSVAFSPDGRLLVSGSQDRTARLWNLAGRRPLGTYLPVQPMGVNSVRFGPTGSLLATGADDGTVMLWDLARAGKGAMPRGVSLPIASTNVHSLAFSPDGGILAAGTQSYGIVLWNARTRTPIGQPPNLHTDAVIALAFNPAGTILASGSQDTTIRLWSMPGGQPLGAPLKGHTDAVDAVAFSPDGTLLASCSADGTIRLWSVPGGRPYGVLPTGHTGAVTSVAFSPDGRLLVSAGLDGTVRLWEVTSGQEVGPPLTGHAGAVTSVAFSPDGTLIASGGADHTIRIWDVSLASWGGRACAVAGRNLTRQEWRQYLGDLPYSPMCPGLL